MTENQLEKEAAQLRQLLQDAIECRSHAILYTLARRIYDLLSARAQVGVATAADQGAAWVQIESLSQLRAVVGGRFQNLKQKWVGAGFPLREHRGDRALNANVNYEGWVELAAWISKQGYEVRLAGEGESFLFEVRKLDDAAGPS